jgi:hypothetical protein
MTLISTVTVGSGGASGITFSSIPATFTDLVVKASLRGNGSSTVFSLLLRVNGDSGGSNYVYRNLFANTGGINSENATTSFASFVFSPGNTTNANTFSNTEIYISNYAGSTSKTFFGENQAENNNTNGYNSITAARWTGTAAITSINLIEGSSGTFREFSSASLYGITKGSGGATVS